MVTCNHHSFPGALPYRSILGLKFSTHSAKCTVTFWDTSTGTQFGRSHPTHSGHTTTFHHTFSQTRLVTRRALRGIPMDEAVAVWRRAENNDEDSDRVALSHFTFTHVG